MKKIILRIIILILLFCWMGMVFYFSSHNSTKSSGISFKISKVITHDEVKAKIIEPYIRKYAHLCEYIVGGVLFLGLFLTFDLKDYKQITISILCGILYAVSDEFHQRFVSGRAGQIQDVFIDSIGVAIGVFGLMLLTEIIKRKRNKKYVQSN